MECARPVFADMKVCRCKQGRLEQGGGGIIFLFHDLTVYVCTLRTMCASKRIGLFDCVQSDG